MLYFRKLYIFLLQNLIGANVLFKNTTPNYLYYVNKLGFTNCFPNDIIYGAHPELGYGFDKYYNTNLDDDNLQTRLRFKPTTKINYLFIASSQITSQLNTYFNYIIIDRILYGNNVMIS